MAEEYLTNLNFTAQLLETTTYSWAKNDMVKCYLKIIIPAAVWRMNWSDQRCQETSLEVFNIK